MIHHPIVLGAKLVLLLIIVIVLLALRGVLTDDQFSVAVWIAAAVFLACVVVIWVFAFKMLSNPKSKIGRMLVLGQEARPADDSGTEADDSAALVGKRGVSLSALSPSGHASIDGRRMSVMTDGQFVEPNRPVEVVKARGAWIVVRAVVEDSGTPDGAE